jgi:hypothetical protein
MLRGMLRHPILRPFLILILASGAAILTYKVQTCSSSGVVSQCENQRPWSHCWNGVLCWLLNISILCNAWAVSFTMCCLIRKSDHGTPANCFATLTEVMVLNCCLLLSTKYYVWVKFLVRNGKTLSFFFWEEGVPGMLSTLQKSSASRPER